MQSSDFGAIVSPLGAGSRLARARGGKVDKAPQKQKPNIVVVLPPPHPLMGALMLAMLHHHLKQRAQGALQRQVAPQQRAMPR